MALGRGNSITDKEGRKRMPMSISKDGGRTWTYHATEFTPIDGGQRLVLMRLQEGPLLLVSFTDHPQRTPEEFRGIDFGGVERMLDGGAWTKQFIMDGTIHILSSRLHYAFNLAWLLQ